MHEIPSCVLKAGDKAFMRWMEGRGKKIHKQNLKVYVYEQKIPRDGHGYVVIIDETRELADAQFLNRYQKKWPKSSAAGQLAHLKNAKVTVMPVFPSIVLDDHGI